MGILSWFKKKKKVTKKEMTDSMNKFHQLWNMDIKEIWNIEDRNAFVSAMIGYLNRKSNYGETIDVLTPKEKTVYIVDSFQSEVHNGGFEQFLLNSSGALADELLSSLYEIGANEIAEIYKKAFAKLPSNLPTDEKQRDSLLTELITEESSKIFDSCDQQFYKSSDNLDELLYQFIMSNKESFV